MPVNFFNSDWLTEFVKQFFVFLRRLSKPTRQTITALLVLMTFWFVSIYFIGRHFYDSNPTWIIVLFCFVISVSWLVANVFLIVFYLLALPEVFNGVSPDTDDLILIGGLNAVTYLTIILCISIYNHFAFRQFILWCCGYPVFALTLIGIGFLITKIPTKPRQ